MPPGFLVVSSEPGVKVTLDEFQDWYNNEHVPLRLNHLPAFLTGARYSASDGLKPSWLALYDIDDTSTFQQESYTRLRANRSPREVELIGRLELLDRRTCELVYDSGESELTTSLNTTNPTKALYTQGISTSSESNPAQNDDNVLKTWMHDNLHSIKSFTGWARSRIFKCLDNLRNGLGVGNGPEEQVVPKYYVLHEFVGLDFPMTAGINDSLRRNLPDTFAFKESRSWSLYKAYPSIAQGNVNVYTM